MAIAVTKRRSMTPARRARIFDSHGGVCGFCHEAIEPGQPFEVDHAVPLWFGGADDDGPNAYPIHTECHRLKTFGRERDRRRYSDISRIAKAKRLRAERLGAAKPNRRSRGLADPRYVRKVSGCAALRDGTERRMR